MAVILEGFDNSGKTTLANLLAKSGLQIIHPGPKPKTEQELITCLVEQVAWARLPVVMDRVTAISQPCYRGKDDPLMRQYRQQMIDAGATIVYCRPPEERILDLSSHQVKSYDDTEHLEWLKAHGPEIIRRYDALFESLPHVRYDWTQGSFRKGIGEILTKMGVPKSDHVTDH